MRTVLPQVGHPVLWCGLRVMEGKIFGNPERIDAGRVRLSIQWSDGACGKFEFSINDRMFTAKNATDHQLIVLL